MIELQCWKDIKLEVALTQPDATTSASEPATGLTGVQMWISATKGGTEIHATLKKTLSELSGEDGTYREYIDVIDAKAHLIAGPPSYTDKKVYLALYRDGDIETEYIPAIVREFPAG